MKKIIYTTFMSLLFFLPHLAMAVEEVALDFRFLPVSCVLYEEDRLNCNGVEQPQPTVRIKLDNHVNRRQIEMWTGSYRKQLNAEGHLFDTKISVTKRYEKMFKTTSYEVSVSAHEAGHPLSGVRVHVETSHVSVNSSIKNLNAISVDGPRILKGNQIWYPHLSVAVAQ